MTSPAAAAAAAAASGGRYGSVGASSGEAAPLLVDAGGGGGGGATTATTEVPTTKHPIPTATPTSTTKAKAAPPPRRSPWSRLVFGWFAPLLELGNAKPQLDPADLELLPLPDDCKTAHCVAEFDRRWEDERRRAAKANAAAAAAAAAGAAGAGRGGEDGAAGKTVDGAAGGSGDHFHSTSSTAPTASPPTPTGTTVLVQPSLTRTLALSFGADFLRAGLLKLIHDLCIFVGPQVLNGLIYYLRDAKAPLHHGLVLTLAVTTSQLTMSFCLRHYFFRCYLTGLRVRTSVVMAVYRKALVLAASERQVRTAGEIVNLMSVDAQRMQDLTTYLHAVWYSFVQIGLAIFFLWRQLGPSCLGGVAVILIMMPVTRTVARWMGGMQKRLMSAKDARVEVNNEVLGSMKVIKLQAWEDPFQRKILRLRQAELRRLYEYVVANSLSIMLWSAVPLLVALSTFAAYTLSGNELDVASALTALALFEILRFPLFMLPQIVNRMVEASVSISRVRSFLLCNEHVPVGPGGVGAEGGIRMDDATFVYEGKKPPFEMSGGKGGAGGKGRCGGIRDALSRELHDARWEVTLLRAQLADAEGRIRSLLRKQQQPRGAERDFAAAASADGDVGTESTVLIEPQPPAFEDDYAPDTLLSLKRVNFHCRRGELIAVVGHVGSGKSTFLNAILGEVRAVAGTVGVGGSLAYFPQTPFVMNDTVRSNIVFGRRDEPFDEDRYDRAVSTCALRHDLQLLPDGDLTEIGERGITLSGGQKARVAMARAVYHDADVYLLDDPLAAVDAHVGKHMFQKCIVDELLLGTGRREGTESSSGAGSGAGAGADSSAAKRSTVILATNALQYLSSPMVDRIVVLRDGRVEEQGTYADLSGDSSSLFASFLAVMAETGGGYSGAEEDGSASVDSPLPRNASLSSMSMLADVDEPEVSRILLPKQKLPESSPCSRRRASMDHRSASLRSSGPSHGSQRRKTLDHQSSGLHSPRHSWDGQNRKTMDRQSSGLRSSGHSNGGQRRLSNEQQPKSDVHTSDHSDMSLPPNQSSANKDEDAAPTSSTPLMTDEFQEREVGHVGLPIYLAWARAAGGAWVGVAIIFSFGAVEGINVLSKWWLTHWSQHGGADETSQMKFLGVYAMINISAIVATFGRLLLLMLSGLKASEKIYTRLLDVVLRAPMSFFDTTPIGRIINRFSKDMYTVDEELVSTLRSYLSTLTTVIGVIFVVSAITPVFTLCLIPIMMYYIMQQRYFTMCYRELKRLDSVSRSPLYALLGETLDGVSTIRAFAAQPTLLNRIVAMLDLQQNAYYLTCAAQCWLAIRLELAGTLIICFACLCSVFEHSTQGGDEAFAGLAGLSISFALTVTQSLNWSVRMGSDLEANFVAVERIEQYTKIPSEADRETDGDRCVGPDWPKSGLVEFRNARLRYRSGLPLVLKGLDLEIPAHSKVGVVGRTGAGKSTLMVALLRIVELDGGAISIDGIDIASLGLKKLRSKIAVIPQDPILFSGTVKTNLDPFNEYDDGHLYEVLRRVGLVGSVSRTPSNLSLGAMSNATSLSGMSGAGGPSSGVKSLDDKVFEGGSNFSVGQRQLLVIARALLCGAQIVIMDEATASVDADTDARIQRVMRTEFRDSTCITVAHRINTILDSDYILCMDDGRAAEFDTPANLLARGGLFKDLVDAWEKEHVQ